MPGWWNGYDPKRMFCTGTLKLVHWNVGEVCMRTVAGAVWSRVQAVGSPEWDVDGIWAGYWGRGVASRVRGALEMGCGKGKMWKENEIVQAFTSVLMGEGCRLAVLERAPEVEVEDKPIEKEVTVVGMWDKPIEEEVTVVEDKVVVNRVVPRIVGGVGMWDGRVELGEGMTEEEKSRWSGWMHSQRQLAPMMKRLWLGDWVVGNAGRVAYLGDLQNEERRDELYRVVWKDVCGVDGKQLVAGNVGEYVVCGLRYEGTGLRKGVVERVENKGVGKIKELVVKYVPGL
jgi:hypothetical protein